MVRCKASFTRISDFRTSYLAQGPGQCFVAHQGDLETDAQVSIRLVVAGQPPLELEGRVQRNDFDEQGNEGVLVELTPDSVAAVTALDARLGTDVEATPPELGPAPEPAPPPPPAASSVSGLHRFPSITAPTVGPKGAAAPAPPPLAPLTALVSGPIAARLDASRNAVANNRPPMGVFVRFEVVGLDPETEPGRACLARVLEVVALRDGFVDARDASGVLIGFCSSEALPVGRAVAAMLAAKEAVVDEAASRGAPAQLTAALVGSELEPRGATLAVTGLSKALALEGRLQPGQLACEKPLEAAVSKVATLTADPVGALIIELRLPSTAPAALTGRAPVLEAVDRRLTSIAEPTPGLVLRGAPGSGRTALAAELAELGRKRGLAVTVISASDSWKKRPGAGLAALACEACGLPFEHRATRLRPALEALQMPTPFIEAVLRATRVIQPPWACTAGQGVHALRALLRSLAGERPVLLIADGVEHLDESSLEVFAELTRRPTPRELTIALAATDLPMARFEGALVADLPLLSFDEVMQLIRQLTGGTPGPRLAAHVAGESGGLPGLVEDHLQLLSTRGSLAVIDGVAELIDAPPRLEGTSPLAARLSLLPPGCARPLEAAWCQGDSFEPALLAATWPRVTQTGLLRAAELRLIQPVRAKRWAFTSPRVRAAVGALPSKERAAMQQRLAAALAQQADADSSELARVCLEAGEGPAAVKAASAAIEAALRRRAPCDAAAAHRLQARALGLVAAPVERRIEALGRGAGCSLAGLDVMGAGARPDEAVALAQPTQAETADLLLALGRTYRHEGHPEHATDVIERAEFLASKTPLEALVSSERGEAWEAAGQPQQARLSTLAALIAAEAGAAVSRLHGEVDLPARLEARLGALAITAGDAASARTHFETSARRWREAGMPQAEARALSNLASACALAEDFEEAGRHFAAAAEAAGRAGDFLFQGRALLGQAKVLKRRGASLPEVKAVAGEAWKIAGAIGWAQGRVDAEALVSG